MGRLWAANECQRTKNVQHEIRSESQFNPSMTALVVYVPCGTMHIFLPRTIRLSV